MKKILLFAAVLFASNLSRAQWEPDVRLTNALYGSYTSFNNAWCIASSGDSVHVVWYDERDGNQELYYKRSTDGGLSWGEDVRLTYDIAETWEASIAVSGSTVHIVWDECRDGDGEIYYKRSTDGGTSWGQDTRLTNATEWSEFPSLAISGLDLHAVWVDSRDGSYAIYYKRSADGGLSWEPDSRLSYGSAYCGFPSVAAFGSVVHVLWEDERDGNAEIYYKRSIDGGISWGEETRMTYNSAASWDPSVSLYCSVVQLTWMDSRAGGGYEVYYKRSDDGGITWGEDTRLTYATGDSRYPNIAVSGSFVHIVWQDKRDVNEEIYYKQSTDGGISWEDDLRLTNANYASQYASVTSSGFVVHVVWYDNRDMNEEIYYKRNPTGNIFVGTENDLSGNSEQQINIYPNPANRQLTIDSRQFAVPSSQSAVGGQRSAVRLSIVDLYGREIKEFPDISSFPYTMDISDLRDGLYILRISNEDGNTGSVKFLKIAD